MRHSRDIMKMLLKVSLSPSSILCYNCSPRFPNLVSPPPHSAPPPPPLLKIATFLCFPYKNPKILFALPFQPTYVIINMYDIIDV